MEIFDKVDKIKGLKVPKPQLTEEDKRNIYLRNILLGVEQGPLTGYPSKDSVGLKYYFEDEIVEELPKISAYSYLYRNNIADPDYVALNYYGMKVTYGELFSKIEEVAKALKKARIEENDVITLMMPNTPEAIYLFYAASKIGATIHIIDYNMDKEDIEKYIKAVNSKMTFVVPEEYEKIRSMVEDKIIKDAVVVTTFEPLLLYLKTKSISDVLKDASRKDNFTENTKRWKEFIDAGREYEYLNAKLEYVKDRPLLIEHTKGTTGDAKTIVLTNENINAVALQSSHSIPRIGEQEKWLTTVPMSMTVGVTMGIHFPLVNGFETSIVAYDDKDKFDEVLLKNKPNHVIALPEYWKEMLKSEILERKNLSNIATAISTNYDISMQLEKEINEFLESHGSNTKLTKVYGLAEAGGAISCTNPLKNEIGSAGIPFSKTKVGIFNPNTLEEVKYGEDGEICIIGPSVMSMCLNLENTSLQVHDDEKIWLHTGDAGFIDRNGNLFISDTLEDWNKKKEDLRYFDHKVQDILGNYWTIKDCVVTTNIDSKHKNRNYTAYVVLEDDFKEYEEIVKRQLITKCELEFSKYAHLINIEFKDNVEELRKNKNSTSKTLDLKKVK